MKLNNVKKTNLPTALLPLVAAIFFTTGCSVLSEAKGVDVPMPGDELRVQAANKTLTAEQLLDRQIAKTKNPKIEMMDRRFYADQRVHKREMGEWLAKIPFDMPIDTSIRSVSLKDIMKVFSASGINIGSTIPIDSFEYAGLAIRNSDARTALTIILSTVGVDYKVDDNKKTVQIVPMPRKAYNLSINNRTAEYSNQSGGTETGGTAKSGISTTNDFWSTLGKEIESRCEILVPVKKADGGMQSAGQQVVMGNSADSALVNGLQAGMGGPAAAADDEDDLYSKIKTCVHSINPNTGTITVQGPNWVHSDLAEYFDRVNLTMNTRITLKTRIVLMRDNGSKSTGLDFNALKLSAAGKGFAVQNNALGGATLTKMVDTGLASFSATGALAQSFVGYTGDGMQAVMGFLETQGKLTTEMEPTITTVSGVPTTFERVSPIIYFRYTQEASTGEGSGVSITSEEVERQIGSTIRVNPTYDIDRKVVRTQIGIDQRYLTGWQNEVNYLSAGGTIETVPVRVPMIDKISMNGELLLRDGETVVVGGQRFTSTEMNEKGITNMRKIPFLGNLFGSSSDQMETFTYYAIMTVHIDEAANTKQER